MNSTAKAADKFELASNFCVGDYKRLRREKDRGGIAKFIYKRFSERYLAPLFSIPSEKKNGFCMMAIACLMIEALASFRKGWKDTSRKGRGKSAFQSFFDNYEAFAQFREYSEKFYWNVRCGILHQAETKGGWRICRKGSIFDESSLVVNANAFLKALGNSLYDYCEELKRENWDSTLWKNAIKKIDAICDNCARHP